MYVIREVLNCKPGKVRQMVEKFRGISTVLREMGQEPLRVLTDVTGEPFWTIVAEVRVEKIDDFFAMEQTLMANEALRKTMADYHDLVDQRTAGNLSNRELTPFLRRVPQSGRREVRWRSVELHRERPGRGAANEHTRTRGHHRTDLVHHVCGPARVASS